MSEVLLIIINLRDKLVQKTPGTIIKFKLVNLAVAENAFQDYVRKF